MVQSNSSSTTSPSSCVTKCAECGQWMLDKDNAVAVVLGVYTLPPVEKVKGEGDPSIYHEDCFFAVLAANTLEANCKDVAGEV